MNVGIAITLNKYKRIIYNLVKGIKLDEKQQNIVDKIKEDLDKNQKD
jgi:hypothetical protein